ncbi:MAG TPA: type I-E CRISPR-associated protein Cas6/Cse3/CasE [Methylococcus sp.]|nr:type I-E CRISPR-associated protein Cas6/Cse3/CasE [Methylococcus sp.]
MWLARVPMPAGPVYSIHQYLWSYFDLDRGEPRPFLYRIESDGIVMLSRIKPSCPARCIEIEAGRAYLFEALISPVNGGHRAGAKKNWRAIEGNEARRAWLVRRVDGAELRFVHFFDREPLRFLRPGGIRVLVTRCVARGVFYVRDRAAFTEAVLRGPGKGKVWGCGLIYLPEIMA